ncbi:hypothetical protein DNTS_016197 [Danionella cerebrum]|uniref:Uncharacterized protein n=1 Tax=Danionella cerebrum TaxID=2873325 RepID=A0A553Q0H9_9TELE|nr:hypothetical protein DNTS_016197 [Danionella translucida]
MRPRSAVEYRASSSTQMPQISSRVDLSPTTHALAILPRAKSASRLSTGDFSRRSTLTSDSASSVQSVADGDLSVVDIENLLLERVRDKKDDLKVAFEAFDLEGSKTVTRGEFKRIIEGFLVPLTDFQFEGLLAQMGGNLKNITRAFHLFDYNNDGQIQQHELRKVLEGYCFPISPQEFNRFGVNITEPVKWKVFLGLFEDGTRLEEDLCMALENLNCSLTHEQFSTLADFLDEENTDVINYQRFLDLLHLQNPPMEVLKQKLLENYDALMESIINITKNHSDTVLLEELRKLINHYGQSLTEQHFSRLCEPFLEGSQVYYKRFLKSLGVPEKMECVVERKDAEREASTLNRRKQDMKVIVLRKLKERLQRRRMTLPDYLMSIRKNKTAELTLRDFSKVLDDCGISLEESQLQMLKESLGFNAGPISVDCFMDEYEDVEIPDKDEEDVLTAFRFMDKNRDGLVNLVDFRPLFDSLMRDGCLENPCDQVHNYLADLAQRHPSKFSEVFCHLSDDCKRILTKNGLKQLLFKHYMPVTPNEFEKLWSRFDEDGNGFVTQTEFLKKLEVTVEKAKEPGILSEKSSDSEFLLQKLRKWIGSVYGSVSRNLVILDKNKEGHVTVAELLSLLQIHGFELTENQLTHLLNLLGFDACLKELPYLDFLTRLVGHPGDTPEGPATHSTESLEDVEELSPGRAIQKLKELVTSSTETLHKAFSAFDKTGDGLVTQVEFRQVLDNFCIRLSNVQFRKLLSELRIKEGEDTTVDWKEFLKVFNLDSQETADEWVKKIRKIRFPNQSQPLTISEILKRIQEVVSARIYTITQEMIDLDYANKNTISRMDFKTICARHFMRLSDNQSPDNFHRPSTAGKISALILNCEDVEIKVRPRIQNCWKLIQRRCRQADPERTGEVPVATFMEILKDLHIGLSSAEFKQLSVKYDIKASGRVSYLHFLRHFVLMFSGQGDTSSRRLKLQPPRTLMSPGPLSTQCVETMLRISRPVQLVWREMRQRFISFDKERTGKVSLLDFRKVLKQFSLNLGVFSTEAVTVGDEWHRCGLPSETLLLINMQESPGQWNISFAGCGFLMAYYCGVYCSLYQRAQFLFKGATKICGASSGALMGAVLACQISPVKCCENLLEMSREARKGIFGAVHPSFNLLKTVRNFLTQELPDDAHLLASGRLFVSLTRVSDGKNVLVSEFSSKEDLIQALICSCFYPLYCGVIPPSYHGIRYIDGALSDNMPFSNLRNTITISPFSGESDIRPYRNPFYFHEIYYNNVSIDINFMNAHRVVIAFFPPEPEVCGVDYSDAVESAVDVQDDTKKDSTNSSLKVSRYRHTSIDKRLK